MRSSARSAHFSGMLVLLAFASCPLAARTQALDARQMEQALNAYDRPGLFSSANQGASNPVPQAQQQFSYPAAQPAPQQQYPPQPQYAQQAQYSYAPQTAPQVGGAQYGYGFPPQQAVTYPLQAPMQPQAQAVSPLRALFSAGQAKPTPAPKPVNPLQYVMQQFLGGSAGTNSGGGSGNDQQKLYNAREYLQTANDQASRAYNACQRASYGSDTYAKKQASSEAYYAAQAARYAANNATSAAAGGSSAANDAAAQARDAADRAQASADQASSNANGGGGW